MYTVRHKSTLKTEDRILGGEPPLLYRYIVDGMNVMEESWALHSTGRWTGQVNVELFLPPDHLAPWMSKALALRQDAFDKTDRSLCVVTRGGTRSPDHPHMPRVFEHPKFGDQPPMRAASLGTLSSTKLVVHVFFCHYDMRFTPSFPRGFSGHAHTPTNPLQAGNQEAARCSFSSSRGGGLDRVHAVISFSGLGPVPPTQRPRATAEPSKK